MEIPGGGEGGGTRLFEARAYWRKYRSHLVEAPVQRFQKFSLSVRRLASVFSVHLELSLAIASLFFVCFFKSQLPRNGYKM